MESDSFLVDIVSVYLIRDDDDSVLDSKLDDSFDVVMCQNSSGRISRVYNNDGLDSLAILFGLPERSFKLLSSELPVSVFIEVIGSR